MNKRTFLKTLGVGSVAAVAAPLSLFAQPAKVADDLKLTECWYIPPPIRFLGYDWQPTRLCLTDTIKYLVNADKKPIGQRRYAIIIEFGEQKQNCWQIESIHHKPEDAKNILPLEDWNGLLWFHSLFRCKLNQDRYYVAFIPLISPQASRIAPLPRYNI